MKFIVYCHTNKITKKSYVGFTQHTMNERWLVHCKNSITRTSTFYSSMRKHGLSDNIWSHVIVEEHDDIQNAKDAEQFFIAYLRTLSPSGYNMTKGGDGGSPIQEVRDKISKTVNEHCDKVKAERLEQFWILECLGIPTKNVKKRDKNGWKLNSEVKEKIKKGLTGHKQSATTKAKRSKALKILGAAGVLSSGKGKSPPNKGIRLTDEQRKEISDRNKGQIAWNSEQYWILRCLGIV